MLTILLTVTQCLNCGGTFALPSTKSNHGDVQVLRLLRDRPQMSKFVSQGDLVWKLVASYFDGKICNSQVSWNSVTPAEEYYVGCHRYPTPARKECYIKLRAKNSAGEMLDGELLWSCLIFEFYNLGNSQRIYEVYQQAINGKILRKDWIHANTRLEYEAIEPTQRFYKYIWIPHLRKKGLKSNELYWDRGYKPTYTEWINQYTDPKNYPETTWGKAFDEITNAKRK